MSRSTDWIRSLVCAPARSQKIDETRFSASPESSSAASVLSMVGAAGLSAIAAISFSCAAKAASKTGQESLVRELAEIRQVERSGPVGERVARQVDGSCFGHGALIFREWRGGLLRM